MENASGGKNLIVTYSRNVEEIVRDDFGARMLGRAEKEATVKKIEKDDKSDALKLKIVSAYWGEGEVSEKTEHAVMEMVKPEELGWEEPELKFETHDESVPPRGHELSKESIEPNLVEMSEEEMEEEKRALLAELSKKQNAQLSNYGGF
jgi:hypothetical protein